MNRILFDFDGVIRFYPMEITQSIELEFGLEIGLIYRVALNGDLIQRVTTGAITRREWIKKIGERIGSMQAAQAWNERYFYIDSRVIELIIALQQSGIPVDLITNGTCELRQELSGLGIACFCEVFNSSDIGWAKPDRHIYDFVLNKVKCDPKKILFIDDSQENISTAISMGFNTFMYDESRFHELVSYIVSETLNTSLQEKITSLKTKTQFNMFAEWYRRS